MQKFLTIALLILCITAKKYHKSDEKEPEKQPEKQPEKEPVQDSNPMVQCLEKNCMNEAFGCFFDEECAKTMDSCEKEYGDNIRIDELVKCSSDNKIAIVFSECMEKNCNNLGKIMRFLNRRN
ncbi:unnamed protein product [Paramecium sonneborni]|uniref:Uncharacterized protein n=1 Tax=Paramecium sonneborni TaxID=65129 RepID=A0A8S1QNC3_9CILI|nr:unnamed protein product [Paramecium sonneborni]